MANINLITLLPLLILGAGIIIIMLVIAFQRNHALTVALTLVTLGLGMATMPATLETAARQETPLIIVDGYAVLYMVMLFAVGIVVTVLSYGYMEGRRGIREEYYVLLLIATLGSAVIVSSDHFASFFLGLEILSVSLYALIAYPRAQHRQIEAGIKYLILAAMSVAFLLFGMALVYAELGTMEFSRIVRLTTSGGVSHSAFILTGFSMLLVGIGFKLALVPFHLWTPDVYEGAPAPVTAFIATGSKGAMFALLLRYFTVVDIHDFMPLFVTVAIIAVLSMFFGNLLALLQTNVKRILAYSSISHMGYVLVAFLASGPLRVVAVTFYLAAYFITSLGAFGVISVLSDKDKDLDRLEDYRGLAYRRFWLAAIFSAMLLSLAGIPLTAGFFGKFYVVTAGVDSSLWWLVIILVINSAIGLFYYLRVIVTVHSRPDEPEGAAAWPRALAPSFSLAAGLMLAMLTFLLIWLGVYPAPFIRAIQALVTSLV